MKPSQKKDKSPAKIKKIGKTSPKKPQQSNTIISMFKNQNIKSKRLKNADETIQKKSLHTGVSKGDNQRDKSSESDDGDIAITKVEQKSPYFRSGSKHSSFNEECITEKHKRIKLSLRKSGSRQSGSFEDTGKCAENFDGEFNSVESKCRRKSRSNQTENCRDNSKSGSGSASLKQYDSNLNSLKETKTDCSDGEFTPVTMTISEQDLDPCSSSQKENSGDKIVHKRTSNRLSLSKRKSSTSEFVSKRRKISSELSENSQNSIKERSDGNPEKCNIGRSGENLGKCDMEAVAKCSKIMNAFEVTEKSAMTGNGNHHERSYNEEYNLNVKSNLSVKQDGNEGRGDKESQRHVQPVSESGSDECLMPGNPVSEGTKGASGEDDETNQTEEPRVPYYLDNFRTLVRTVMEDEDNICLFNDDDMKYITGFSQLSESAQKLYVRIFSRKWTWLPITKIKYPEITEDIATVVEELARTSYLLMSDSGLTDLETTLNLLQAGEIKSLAKMYHMTKISQNKSDMVRELIKKSKQNTIGTMFKTKGIGGADMMLNRAKQLLGKCFIQMEDPRNLFIRMLMLFSLPNTIIEDDASGGQNQLFQMLMVNMGKVVFPAYKVNKKTKLFVNRSSLIRFSEASILEHEIFTHLEKNDYNSAFDIYNKAVEQFEMLSKDKELKRFDSGLPVFLRPYTAGSMYVRILSQGVEILQRRRNYKDAVTLLHTLLKQECYCPNYRGRWWDRLALNYDAHLKDELKALDVIKDGLKDSLVKTGHRLSLYQRAEKICTTTSGSKYKCKMKDIYHDKLVELPQQIIEGTMLSDNVPGMKYKFMIKDLHGIGNVDDVTFCGVEELVLQHYKQNGYPQGVHGEGSVVSCLFCLYFWDIIFQDVDDTFHSPYQTHPLDLYYGDFYINRKADIDDRITIIQKSTEEELLKMLADSWDKYNGVSCVGMNWDRFDSLQHAQGLVSCMKGPVLSGILERYGKDPKNTRGGFPDLTLWNTDAKTLKISEVKGPGDRLSHKQILWLDYLLKLGVDAEVCHVKGVGSKRLKPSAT